MVHGIGRWVALGISLFMSVGLGAGSVGRTDAQESTAWQAFGPSDQAARRLHTPRGGALFAETEGGLLRSDDDGLTWAHLLPPDDAKTLAVSPLDQQVLYAAGSGGVYRSVDGGGSWTRVSDPAGTWNAIAASPADPNVLYGVTSSITEGPDVTVVLYRLQVSHNAGATWTVVRTYDEHRISTRYPCGYTFSRIVPDGASSARVLTIEGCTVRDDPRPMMSTDEGRTTSPFPVPEPSAQFPSLSVLDWGANAAVGGQGVNPGRWYVSSFRANILYTRIHHSRIMRTDDAGASWTTVYDDDSGDPYKNPRAVDFVSELAYNPGRPDDVFAVFQRYEPNKDRYEELKPVSFAVRMSRDGGVTWTDLGAEGLPQVYRLAVGVDGHYLYAATARGIFRLALPAEAAPVQLPRPTSH